jgi:hypothetical protein
MHSQIYCTLLREDLTAYGDISRFTGRNEPFHGASAVPEILTLPYSPISQGQMDSATRRC